MMFVDLAFPATDASLGEFGVGAVMQGPGGRVVWARPQKFCRRPPRLFAGGILPSDILQGALGDCWFLCALSVLAEDPQLIRAMFLTGDEELRRGYCGVRLLVDGCPREVVVDTQIPVYEASMEPCFAKSKGGELWVILMEKAYAKVLGGTGI